jgi:hypothetical protein
MYGNLILELELHCRNVARTFHYQASPELGRNHGTSSFVSFNVSVMGQLSQL